MVYTLFKAGCDEVLPYQFTFLTIRHGVSEARSILMSRFIEFWCKSNCNGRWSVDDKSTHLTASFEDVLDIVLFKISSEYNYFDGKASLMVLPTP